MHLGSTSFLAKQARITHLKFTRGGGGVGRKQLLEVRIPAVWADLFSGKVGGCRGGFRLIASRISSNFSPNFRSSFRFHERNARHLQETYSNACRYIVGYLRVERWKMADGYSFPLIFLPSHPFSKSSFLPSRRGVRRNICTLSFLSFLSTPFRNLLPRVSFPSLEVKLLGNWKTRDVEIFGGKLVHCFVTIRVVDPWRDKNNVFIWKNCLFEIIIIIKD